MLYVTSVAPIDAAEDRCGCRHRCRCRCKEEGQGGEAAVFSDEVCGLYVVRGSAGEGREVALHQDIEAMEEPLVHLSLFESVVAKSVEEGEAARARERAKEKAETRAKTKTKTKTKRRRGRKGGRGAGEGEGGAGGETKTRTRTK